MPQTYHLLVNASADTGHSRFKAGERHEALIFVVADTLGAATERGLDLLRYDRWREITVLSAEFTREDEVEEPDPAIRAARRDAREQGIGIVIWTPPLAQEQDTETRA